MRKSNNSNRRPIGREDRPEDEDEDSYDSDEDESNSDNDSSSDDSDEDSKTKARQGSRRMKHTQPYHRRTEYPKQREEEDTDCGGFESFEMIYSPIQYIQNLMNGGCDDDTVIVENTSSSASFSSAPSNDKVLHSAQRRLRKKSPPRGRRERGRERGDKAHDDHKYNASPSSQTKSRNTKSDSRIDILDDSFYEIDIHQKKSHESTNIASVRPRSPHPTDSSSPDKHHGNLKPALKSSLKHSSTDSVIQDTVENISPHFKSITMNNTHELSPLKKNTLNNVETTATTKSSSSTAFNFDSFLEEMSTVGMVLSWHKQNKKSLNFDLTTSVRSFIEIADTIHASNTKTIWEPYLLLEEELDTTGNNLKPLERRRICLFDIMSITRPNASALRDFPYLACPGHFFVLTLPDGDILVLESDSESDVKRIVLGLRWTIARLSFNIVIGNPDMCEELLPLRRFQYSVKPVIVDSAELHFIMKSVTKRLLDSFET